MDSKDLVGMTVAPAVVTGDIKSKSSSPSSLSLPLPYGMISFSQLKLNTASAPHPTGRKPSICLSRNGCPQLSAAGFSSLNVKTAQSGMLQEETFKYYTIYNVQLPPKSPCHLCPWSDKDSLGRQESS